MVLAEEDIQEITDALSMIVQHERLERLDVSLSGNKNALVYWAGNVLRVDIKGLRQ